MIELNRGSGAPESPVPETLENYVAGNPILKQAYGFAEKAHEGQMRAEGIPYFTHCLAVVRILYEEWGAKDTAMLSAGFLHDTVEDIEEITNEDIKRGFGEKI